MGQGLPEASGKDRADAPVSEGSSAQGTYSGDIRVPLDGRFSHWISTGTEAARGPTTSGGPVPTLHGKGSPWLATVLGSSEVLARGTQRALAPS